MQVRLFVGVAAAPVGSARPEALLSLGLRHGRLSQEPFEWPHCRGVVAAGCGKDVAWRGAGLG